MYSMQINLQPLLELSHLGAGKMAQPVKFLPCKHDNHPQYRCVGISSEEKHCILKKGKGWFEAYVSTLE